MARYNGLIIPRSYNDYFSRSDPAGLTAAVDPRTLPEKTTLADNDVFLIRDADDGLAKELKGAAIAGEYQKRPAELEEKTALENTDYIAIEDANGNGKKIKGDKIAKPSDLDNFVSVDVAKNTLAGDVDFNTITDIGEYGCVAYASNLRNFPLSSIGAIACTIKLTVNKIGISSNNVLVQRLEIRNNNTNVYSVYERMKVADTWTEWKRNSTVEGVTITNDFDMNNLFDEGVYNCYGFTPSNIDEKALSSTSHKFFGIIEVKKYSNDPIYIEQVIRTYTGGNLYQSARRYEGVYGQWGAWQSFATETESVPFAFENIDYLFNKYQGTGNDANNIVKTGICNTNSETVNLPDNADHWGTLLTLGNAGNRIQFFYSWNSGSLWTRANHTGYSWLTWKQM